MGLIGFLIVGLLAGWLAGLILRDEGMGIFRNLVVGVIGAYLGGYLFDVLGIPAGGLLGSLVMATVGAILLLFLIGLMRRAGGRTRD